ncbi:hypothetical protein [Rhodococcus sp. 06-156-3C]|uniref:hypothetical protein n=1 Tax=Rhodococcus sp. 06-156-3C TaxID=2022486 RepID=UPI0011401025|nr:hypothetical protein [Rhodococcus sp. 06-156-3C]
MPHALGNESDDAVFLASNYGLIPDEWQENVLRGWMGVLPTGKWAAPRCGLAVPRQNGKNGALEVRELYGMIALGERILHTAHEVKTARKAFLRLLTFFDNPKFPDLVALVKEIRKTNGQEAIVLHNGGSIEFVARSKGSGRGFSVDVLVMDEAQDLAEEAQAALLPTISASANSQTIVTGTPPDGTTAGEVFTRMRTSGHAGWIAQLAGQVAADTRLCWHEWSFEDNADLDDPNTWAEANPALGIRLQVETITDERAAMDDDTFGRERGGMWVSVASQRVIGADDWRNIGLNEARPDGMEISIAVDMAPDRNSTTLCAVGFVNGGKPCIDVKDTKPGAPDWVVTRIVEAVKSKQFRVRAVVIDGAGPAASLIDALRAEKIEPTVTSSSHMKRACGAFYDGVVSGRIRHMNQAGLNVAVGAVRKRKLEDAFAWQRKDPESDITPVVAATLALWGLTAVDVKRPRKSSGGAAFF